MLVLTVPDDGEIVLSNGVTIRLVKGSTGKARLGITAPAEVRIDRKEVLDRYGPLPERKPLPSSFYHHAPEAP
jgi:sRNA-binding carbon storage regulator CsrA